MAAVSGTAHAGDPQTCTIEGDSSGFKIYKVTLSHGGPIAGMTLAGGGIHPLSGPDTYYGTEGIQVIDAQTGLVRGYFLRGVTGQSPHVTVSSGAQHLANAGLPVGPYAPLGWSAAYPIGAFGGPGTYYIVGFGIGAVHYNVSITWRDPVGNATCVEVPNPPARLIQLDQTDFSGVGADIRTSGQVYAPGAGVADNVHLDLPISNRFVGYFLAGAYGDMRLDYETPAETGAITSGRVEVHSWGSSVSHFKLQYQGVLPSVDISGWDMALPLV